jgi:hypothetical protein
MLTIRSEIPTDLDAIYGVNCAALSGDAEARMVVLANIAAECVRDLRRSSVWSRIVLRVHHRFVT